MAEIFAKETNDKKDFILEKNKTRDYEKRESHRKKERQRERKKERKRTNIYRMSTYEEEREKEIKKK